MLVSGQGRFFFQEGTPLLEGVGIQQPAPAMVKSPPKVQVCRWYHLSPASWGGRFPVPEDRNPPRGGGKKP